MQSSYLTIEGLTAAYDSKANVISDITFNLDEGDLACLLGPSGCGKTTVLRAISGFQTIRTGRITLAGNEISTPKDTVPPEHRNVGMVFQDHALFPHLSLGENVGFGLQKLPKNQRQQRVRDMLSLIGMQDKHDVYPHEISGGQSQRVALARALAPEPTLLLMDEPFSNLDTALRESLGYEVRQLLKETGITAIMVTHDQHDAFALGDKIGVIADGELKQWGTAFDLYHAPQSRFVADFVGDGVFVNGQLLNKSKVRTAFGEIGGQLIGDLALGADVELLLRPDDVRFERSGNINATISRKAFKGAQTLYTLETASGDSLMSLVPSHEDYEIGDAVAVVIDADHLVCFSR